MVPIFLILVTIPTANAQNTTILLGKLVNKTDPNITIPDLQIKLSSISLNGNINEKTTKVAKNG